VPPAESEGVAGGERRQREGRGLEGGVPPAPAHQPGEQRGRPGDERSAPGAEHDHRGDVDTRRDAEDSGADGLADARAFRLLDQLRRERGCAQQGERRQRPVQGRERAAGCDSEAAGHGQIPEQGKPHECSIGTRRAQG